MSGAQLWKKWKQMGVNEFTFRTAESDLKNLEAHMNAIKKNGRG